MSLPKISIVLPLFNCEATIGRALDSIVAQAYPNLDLILMDGGSRDGTLEIARGRAGIRIVEGPAGRGLQLNRGASATHGELFLFLHSDCRLPAGWRPMIETALADEDAMLCLDCV